MAKDDSADEIDEMLNEKFPDLVGYFRITPEGKHVFDFYKKMEERIVVPKGYRTRRYLELVCTLEKKKEKETEVYVPTYIADIANVWNAVLAMTLRFPGVCVSTDF